MNKKNKGARIKGRSENNKKKMRHKETWNSDNHVQNKDLKDYKTRRPRQDFCLRLSERSGLLFVSIQWIQPLILIDSDLDSYSFHTHFIPPNPSACLSPVPLLWCRELFIPIRPSDTLPS